MKLIAKIAITITAPIWVPLWGAGYLLGMALWCVAAVVAQFIAMAWIAAEILLG